MEMFNDWYADNSHLLIDYGINLLWAIVIYWIGSMFANGLSKLVAKIFEKRKLDAVIVSFMSNLVYCLLMAVVIIAALGKLGVQTTSVIAIIGAAGLAIGLALQGSLSNFAAGVLIIAFKPFRSGDFIEAGGTSGVVEGIKLFSTMLRTPDNKVAIVPNSSITGGVIINYSTMPTRRIDLVVGVSYDADIKHASAILNEIVANNPQILKDPGAVVAVSELADSSVNFVVRPWVKTEDYWGTYFELMETIKIRLDEENIGIPYPQMDLHIQKTSESSGV